MPSEPTSVDADYPIKPKRKGTPRVFIPPDDLREILRRYSEGESEISLARAFHVGRHTIRGRLIDANLPIRGMAQNKKVIADRTAARLANLPTETIVAAYNSGRSLRSLANEYHASMTMIKRVIIGAGVTLRGIHELQIASVQTELARGHYTRLAHASVAARGEDQMRDILWAYGLRPMRQGVVGPYNIDLLLPSVAVEIHWNGGHPLHDVREVERVKNLTSWGWDVFYIWVTNTHPLSQSAADDLLTFMQSADRTPARHGRYRVIRGSGEFVTEGSSDLD